MAGQSEFVKVIPASMRQEGRSYRAVPGMDGYVVPIVPGQLRIAGATYIPVVGEMDVFVETAQANQVSAGFVFQFAAVFSDDVQGIAVDLSQPLSTGNVLFL